MSNIRRYRDPDYCAATTTAALPWIDESGEAEGDRDNLLMAKPARLAVVDFEDTFGDINEDELMDAQQVLHMPRRLRHYHPPYLRTQQCPHLKNLRSVLTVLHLWISFS